MRASAHLFPDSFSAETRCPTSEASSAAAGFALPIFKKASVPAFAGPARSVALLPTQMQPEYPYNFLV
jgi:hypothetical protein